VLPIEKNILSLLDEKDTDIPHLMEGSREMEHVKVGLQVLQQKL
jgi:hypothetical protein